MPPLVVPSGGQLVMRWIQGTENVYNVLGLHLTAGAIVGQAQAQACADVVAAAWATSGISAHVDVGTSIVTVGLRDLRQANLAEFIAPVTGCVGIGAGERVSHALACVVTLRTARAGKSYRGRTFLPLDAQAAYDAEIGQYLAQAVIDADDFMEAIRSGLTGSAGLSGNFQLAVISRPKKEDPTTWSTPVISSQVRSNLAGTQRRRLPHRP